MMMVTSIQAMTMIIIVAAISIATNNSVVKGFTIPQSRTQTQTHTGSTCTPLLLSSTPSTTGVIMDDSDFDDLLPDINELSTAPFMKQVQYGSEMANALLRFSTTSFRSTTERNHMKKLLNAQLSHSDGIRGFMVAYLTGERQSQNVDNKEGGEEEEDSEILLETLRELFQKGNDGEVEELVSLMCMNAIMPTAMVSMHTDPDLSSASKLTSIRGIKLLQNTMKCSSLIENNLNALLEAATMTEAEREMSLASSLVDYWNDFYDKWGYEDRQKEDIATTMKELLLTK
ncbi:MAG: hypothetical protein ACI90V_001187 [Bacillariaceae sp.]|jgi:hypothetical protein